MYEEYYGFVQPPFSLTPDPRFLYRSESHDVALQQVWQAIRRKEGFVVLSGDIGTGKTTLCRTLLEQFDETTFTALILNPFLSVEELLREVLLSFGVVSRDAMKSGRLATASKHELIRTLHDFLLSLVPLHGSAVLIIDEAQHLSTDVLEEIRILSNLETNDQKLLQIVIVGQLNLLDLLARSELRQLDQRISIRCSLKALTREEVEAYVMHRLWVARGSTPVSFTAAAFDLVHAVSAGVPRRINLLCDRALMTACEAQTNRVTEEQVVKAAGHLSLELPKRKLRGERADRPLSPRRGKRNLAIGAGVLAVAAGVFVTVGSPWALLNSLTPPAIRRAPTPSLEPPITALPAPAEFPDAEPPPAVPGSFAVVIGTYDTARQVAQVEQALRTQGLPLYVIDIAFEADDVRRRVLLGRFATRAEADKVLLGLGTAGADARVIRGTQEGLPQIP